MPDRVVRAYSFVVGDRGVTVALGVPATVELPWANGWQPVETRYRHGAKTGRDLVVWEVARS